MKCKEAKKLIAGLTGGAISPELSAHADQCPSCKRLLDADSQMRMLLAEPVAVPEFALEQIKNKVNEPVTGNQRGPRNKQMKKKLAFGAIAMIAVCAGVVMYPIPVQAKAKDKFNAMKSAILAADNKLRSEPKIVEGKPLNVEGTAWVVVNGNLTELKMDSPTTGNIGSASVQMIDPTNLEGLPSDVKIKLDEAIKNGGAEGSHTIKIQQGHVTGPDGSKTTSQAWVNGQEVPIEEAQRYMKEHGIEMKIDINLDPSNYTDIKFGEDHGVLLLSPEDSEGTRLRVRLNENTNLPTEAIVEKFENGEWKEVGKRDINIKPVEGMPINIQETHHRLIDHIIKHFHHAGKQIH